MYKTQSESNEYNHDQLKVLQRKYSLELFYPLPKEQDQPLVLIRHGFSEYNEINKLGMNSGFYTEIPPQNRLNKSLLDTKLHMLGQIQAENQQFNVNKIDFKEVFVSPNRRTLETCYLMFKNHPNRQNIKFIVHPLATESLNSLSCLTIGINNIKKEVLENYPEIEFDFSEFDKLEEENSDILFQVYQMRDGMRKKQAIEMINQQIVNEDNYVDLIHDLIKDLLPRFLEGRESVLHRAIKFNDILYKRQELLEEGQKIGLVSHSVFMTLLTAHRRDENLKIIGEKFKNCELLFFEARKFFPDVQIK